MTVRHDERLWDFLATDPSTRIGRLEGLDSIGFLYVTQSRLKVASGYFDVAADRHGELILTVVPKFPPTAATGEVPDALTLLDAVEQGLLGGSDGVERFRRLQRR